MNNHVFKYNNAFICFQSEGWKVMINATEMAKPFGKRPIDWLNLTSTQSFIQTMREVRFPNITPEESSGLIETVRGKFSDGSQQGTWMHEDIALEFARWLSPVFAIWCNDRIKELLKHGITATDNKLEELLANPDLVIGLANQLKSERAKNQLLESCNSDNVKKIEEMQPKVLFADSVASSNKSILIGELSKLIAQNGIKIGQNRLFETLRRRGYLGTRGNNYNIPTQRAMELGIFELKEYVVNHPGGQTSVTITPKVTGKGQVYFINKFIRTT